MRMMEVVWMALFAWLMIGKSAFLILVPLSLLLAGTFIYWATKRRFALCRALLISLAAAFCTLMVSFFAFGHIANYLRDTCLLRLSQFTHDGAFMSLIVISALSHIPAAIVFAASLWLQARRLKKSALSK
ncbi:MAG: hypothetical protein RBU21_13930, partial [FCB group bacterium]|nr:hypothetical protein [FCB group bacterium]